MPGVVVAAYHMLEIDIAQENTTRLNRQSKANKANLAKLIKQIGDQDVQLVDLKCNPKLWRYVATARVSPHLPRQRKLRP